jgi:hypothetical protein
MIKFINKYKQAFTVVGALSVLTVCYLQQKELATLRVETKSKQWTIDSLNNEMFVKDIQIGSYEVMWGKIKEIHPKTAEQVDLEVE